jgi:enterochelin esterase-like enzyme
VHALRATVVARPRLLGAALVLSVAAFVAVGGIGLDRYAWNYWLYRGFPPPHDPAYVTQQGHVERMSVTSPALAGATQPVYVYLPPGYDGNPGRHYPVLYLLHGFPGRPLAFLLTVRAGVVEDELFAKHEARPMILVMPFGSTGTFTDEEWANGASPGEGWADFVSRDVVQAVDRTYRTIPTAAGRGIGGLSEGGYGAINIALHHPHEFGIVESWSGYEKAAHNHSIFGRKLELVAGNSPAMYLPHVARALRRAGTYFWFYSGLDDPLRKQNRGFANELSWAHIPHRFEELQGGHNWALWRGQAQPALLAAARRLAGA